MSFTLYCDCSTINNNTAELTETVNMNINVMEDNLPEDMKIRILLQAKSRAPFLLDAEKVKKDKENVASGF